MTCANAQLLPLRHCPRAKARQMAPDALAALVAAHVERPVAGLIGQPRVNLLRLNMALDAMAGPGAG